MAFHFDLPLYGGFLGVDLFFAISGFVITRGLLAATGSTDSTRLIAQRFVARRASRLLPAAGVCFAVTVALTAVRGSEFGSLSRTISHALAALGGFGNWFVVAFPDRPGEIVRPLLHTWSLGVEEQCYLLLPVLLLWRRQASRTAAFACCAGGVIISLIAGQLWPDPVVGFFITPIRLAPVALGVGLAALLDLVSQPGIDGARSVYEIPGRVADGIGLTLALCVVPALFFADWTDAWLYRGGFVVVGLVFTAMVAIAAIGGRGLFTRTLDSAPLQLIGARSYSLYLVHFPCAYLFGSFDFWVRTVLRVIFAFVLAEILHRFVEYRFLPHGGEPRRGWQFAPAAMIAMGIGGFALGSVT